MATSTAGEAKREKRGVSHGAHTFGHHQITHGLSTGHSHITTLTGVHAIHSVPLNHGAPLATVSSFVHVPPLDQLNAAHLVHPAPVIPIAPAPAIAPITHEIRLAPAAFIAHGHFAHSSPLIAAPPSFDIHHYHHQHATFAQHF